MTMGILYAGCAMLFVSGLLNGAWTTGTQQRGNVYSEPAEERKGKKTVATWLGVGGIAMLLLAWALYLWK